MAISQMTSNDASWKSLLPYKVTYRMISILFAAIALVTFFSSLINPIGSRTFLSISYIVLYVVLIGGFWRMRKWIVTLMGLTMIMLTINNIVRLFLGRQKISSALLALLLVGAIFLFTYISRSHLEGEYRDKGVLGVFIVFLILSQFLLIF